MPVIERLARGEISKRAARDELTVSDTRINAMLAHIRGEAIDPSIARRAMDAKLVEPANAEAYRKRQHSIEPVFGNIKANLGYRRFTRRSVPAVNSGWRLICTAHNLLKRPTGKPGLSSADRTGPPHARAKNTYPRPAAQIHATASHLLPPPPHTTKHHAGWTPRRQPDGSIEWTSPTGHKYVEPPAVYPDRRNREPSEPSEPSGPNPDRSRPTVLIAPGRLQEVTTRR